MEGNAAGTDPLVPQRRSVEMRGVQQLLPPVRGGSDYVSSFDDPEQPIDAYQEIGDGSDGIVLKAARARLTGCCAVCVVPSGIFKSVQVAASVALPAPVSLTIERVEEDGKA